MDYDGYNRRRLTFDASLNLAPAWSPDRRRLAFVSYRKGDDPRIEELDPFTGARRALVAFPGLNITPEWSPSGEELAFATTKDGNSEIYKVDRYGRRFERLTDHVAADLAPTWSPTGRELAFTSDRGGMPQLYLMSADGTNVRPLTYPDQQGSYPYPMGARLDVTSGFGKISADGQEENVRMRSLTGQTRYVMVAAMFALVGVLALGGCSKQNVMSSTESAGKAGAAGTMEGGP